ncbi:unnamed protein product [Rotaria magnacalcarata]|uniref:Uncharacterized protein n=1 Tax=Rotaria magnacalcarata TaxID=392030 RepID=A0A816HJA1_9BILA|nr:unnamed protein product [Rotaria magnacalcarata]CAF1686340.1 unnamed protein product [Rotaria magnacalcarata]CAF2084579.1 unnamed protein product [Rotaria magnacalcarata]CAF3801732.1 unnamed protein product [Rotaria magnacalcarata]CAF3810621.1 unnamed protein product [Rotaria magnacalcarata]
MSIFARWDESNPGDTQKSLIARQFLSTFDLNIRYMTNRTIHILDYPAGENGFNQLKASFDVLLKQENISHTEMVSAIENEPAATLVFLFLSDPKDLSAKVDHLTTYTSSAYPTIWILLQDKYCPHTKEKIPSIWEPLTNAQYYEVRPTLKIMNEKWIGTKFTTGRQGLYDMMDEKDMHMALPLSP